MRTATASIKATKRGIRRPLYGGVSWDPERARGRATQVPACRDNKIEQFRSAWVPVVVVPTDHGLHTSRLLRGSQTAWRALREPLSRRREGPSAVAAACGHHLALLPTHAQGN